MLTAQYFKDFSESLSKSYKLTIFCHHSAEEIKILVDAGQEAIKSANQFRQLKVLSVSEKQILESAIANIHSTLRLIDDSKVGAGISTEAETVSWDDLESAFNGRIKTGVITNHRHTDIRKFLIDAKKHFIVQLKQSLKDHNSLKVNAVLAAEFKIVKDDVETIEQKYFNTKSAPIYPLSNLNKWFTINVIEPIQNDIEEFQEQESGWSLVKLVNLVIKINKYNPMRGSSYIELPEFIRNKKACVNVQNKHDNKCFMWAVLSALHPVPYKDNSNRPGHYKKYIKELNFKGIKFPVAINQVAKFERQNDVSVNVYFLQPKKKEVVNMKGKKMKAFTVLPLHITKQKKTEHVNLLMVENTYTKKVNKKDNYTIFDDEAAVDDKAVETDDEDIDDDCDEEIAERGPYQFHYVWIKNLSGLVGSQVSKKSNKIHICDRCLNYFWSDEKLATHMIDCEKLNVAEKVTGPFKEEDKILRFKNYTHKWRVPFVVYADFECILEPTVDEKRAFQHHEAYSVGYFVKCGYDNSQSEYKSYRCNDKNDESPAKWFVRNLYDLATDLHEKYINYVEMRKLSTQEEDDFNNAQNCHICNKPFTQDQIKVHDHDHLSGE